MPPAPPAPHLHPVSLGSAWGGLEPVAPQEHGPLWPIPATPPPPWPHPPSFLATPPAHTKPRLLPSPAPNHAPTLCLHHRNRQAQARPLQVGQCHAKGAGHSQQGHIQGGVAFGHLATVGGARSGGRGRQRGAGPGNEWGIEVRQRLGGPKDGRGEGDLGSSPRGPGVMLTRLCCSSPRRNCPPRPPALRSPTRSCAWPPTGAPSGNLGVRRGQWGQGVPKG